MSQIINPYGKKLIKVEKEFLGKKLSLEVNRLGFRTSASVLVTYGDTVVLGTAMVSPERLSGFDYFPLSIDYEEKNVCSRKNQRQSIYKKRGSPK
jgi:polyribonucleotide nucleotidyltransferase